MINNNSEDKYKEVNEHLSTFLKDFLNLIYLKRNEIKSKIQLKNSWYQYSVQLILVILGIVN